jgi:hypothetical protein
MSRVRTSSWNIMLEGGLMISACAARQPREHAVFVPDTKEGRDCVLKCQQGFHICSGSAQGVGALIMLSQCKQELQMCALNCPDAFRNPEGELCAADCEGLLCARCPTRGELDAAGSTARVGLSGEAADAAAVKAMRHLSEERAAASP